MRECGFYWCTLISKNSSEVCYWNGRYWELTGNESRFEDNELIIDEKQIKNTGYKENEINGECPECGEPTVDGNAYDHCNWSPVICNECGNAPCDQSC